MLAEEVKAGQDELEEQIAARTALLTSAVTELERQREQLTLLAAVVESTTDAVMTVDADGRITSWNLAAGHGPPRSAAVGTPPTSPSRPGRRWNLYRAKDEGHDRVSAA